MNAALDEVAAVADAVLFEGYLLYPYRASAQKNRLRWQFGVLTPSGFPDEPDRSRTEVLLERRPGAVLHVRLRFLHLRSRTVHGPGGRAVDALGEGDDRRFPWEEGVPREIDAVFPVDACYRLVGLVRLHWKGFDGGAEAWAAIDAFFAELQEGAVAC